MPKIVINEYDLTKAGTGEYANFSVVVPGFLGKLGEGGTRDVFDENDIYECHSQADFEKHVGKRSATIVTQAVAAKAFAPKIDQIIRLNTNFSPEDPTGTTKDTWCDYITEDNSDFECEEFIYADPETYKKVLNKMLSGIYPTKEDPCLTKTTTTQAGFDLYYTINNTSGYVGELRDKNFEYIKVTAQGDGCANEPTVDGETITFTAKTSVSANYSAYYKISADSYESPDGKEIPYIGKNGEYVEDRITHYGNQMAYELLGLGYTVLYKKIDELAPTNEAFNDSTNYVKTALMDEDGKVVYDKNGKEVMVDLVLDTGAKILKPEVSAIYKLSESSFWECLKDKSTYDFRYLVTGLLTGNDLVNEAIREVADHSEEIALDDASTSDGRGDCIALIDLDAKAYMNKTQSEAIPALAKEAAKWSSAYVACFAPYVTYIMAEDKEYKGNKTFPASFHYLACAANSANNNYSEWYANAGYTRGVSKYTIESTGCKLGEIAVQALEPRFILKVGQERALDKDNRPTNYMEDINTTVAVNLIIKIKNSYYLWGNRTGKKLGTRNASDGDLVAQHFLNIRQLSTTIKKQIYVACRRLTFDPNSNMLWINFRSLLTPMLEQMKADQGIKDYQFVKNTTDRKALLSAKVRIVPIEAVEDFEIGLYLEDSLTDVVLTEA